jgi:Zn finger protein HypA/HybF involved in hydrogenase expression
MDELEIAQTVLESILAEAAKVNLRPIRASLSYSQMQGVSKEVLKEAFTAIAATTPCEGMELNLRAIPPQFHCNSCGRVSDYELTSPMCPGCKSHDFQFLPDAPILLEEIEFQEPKAR